MLQESSYDNPLTDEFVKKVKVCPPWPLSTATFDPANQTHMFTRLMMRVACPMLSHLQKRAQARYTNICACANANADS